MSFDLADFSHIVSTIDDFLSMSEPPCSINISNGYTEDEESKEQAEEDKSFISLTFPLKNGTSEIKIYDSIASFTYVNSSGNIIKCVEFDDNVLETNSSFRRAIKQIRDIDRQQANIAKITNTSVDRASFGLAEVN
jgi:hypothetical protein